VRSLLLPVFSTVANAERTLDIHRREPLQLLVARPAVALGIVVAHLVAGR
jgi:hypothetical protein